MTSTAISVVLLDELPEAVLLPDVEGVAGADGRDLLVEDLVVRPEDEAMDTGLGAGLEEEGSGGRVRRTRLCHFLVLPECLLIKLPTPLAPLLHLVLQRL